MLLVLALKPGAAARPEDVIAFLRPRMPAYMVPRYIRFVDALPKTPTAKVQKHVLRAEGIAAGVWDRVEAGIEIKADRLRSPA